MSSPKIKILLVESNDFIKDALRRALEIEGFYVFTAATALQGLKIHKEDSFEVVIADYELPDANGVEFFILINRYRIDNVKILMTTYGELKILSDIHKYGIDDAIEKPFLFQRLVQLIEYNLNKKKTGEHGQAAR